MTVELELNYLIERFKGNLIFFKEFSGMYAVLFDPCSIFNFITRFNDAGQNCVCCVDLGTLCVW